MKKQFLLKYKISRLHALAPDEQNVWHIKFGAYLGAFGKTACSNAPYHHALPEPNIRVA